MVPVPTAVLITLILSLIALFSSLIFLIIKTRKSTPPEADTTEKDLLANEEIVLDSILQAVEDGVIVTDIHNRVRRVSNKAATILQAEGSLLLQETIDQVFPIDKIETSFNRDVTIPLTLHNEFLIQVKIKRLPIISQGVLQGTVYVIHDLTREMEFEKMKSDFVSYSAHQLRTPLTSIKGYLGLLSSTAKSKLNPEEQHFLDRTNGSIDRLTSLIESLISLVQIGGKINLKPTPSSIVKIISDSIQSHQAPATEKGIVIKFVPPETPTPLLTIDSSLIGSVVDNLIQNAIEHSETKKIEIRVRKTDQEVTVDIQDYGKGIPSKQVGYLFTNFYRVPNQLVHATQGNGLGLYMSKTIIDAHKGKIWVNTLPDKGSTFSFSLPLNKKVTDTPLA